MIDHQQSDRFLALLGKEPESARLRAFLPSGHPGKSSDRGRKGPYDLNQAERWQQEGRGLYLVVNDGGDNDADITACRAFFLEWDDRPVPWQLSAWQDFGLGEPTVAITTGGKSAHLYWVLAEPITPAQWAPIQAALIDATGADSTIRNPSRVMRLPGGRYIGADGTAQGQTMIWAASGIRYSLAQVQSWLDEFAPPTQRPQQQRIDVSGDRLGDLPPRPPEALRDALLRIPPFQHGAGQYQQLLGLALRLRVDLGADDAQALLAQTCCQAIRDLPSYFRGTPTQISPGSVWSYLAEQWGIDISRRDLRSTAAPLPAAGSDPQRPTAASKQPAATGADGPLPFLARWAALEAHAEIVSSEPWPLMKAIASLSDRANELDLHRLPARNLEQLLEAAQRRQRPTAAPLLPGATFAIRPTPWAVDGLFRHGVNLLVGQPGAGKSRLSAAGIAAWLRGDRTWLGREMPCDLPPEQRHALIIGTDQPVEDWAITLEPVGLVQRLGPGEVQLHPRLTLHSLETGTALDADGLATIRRWCDAHPHGVVLVDSLAACLPPGIDEDKAAVARPVHALAEAIGSCWAVLTHHSRKAAGKDQNLGVGAGRGSSAIDGAVSRVVGLGLIHKMENGALTPQESDPRRELLSTKRGGATLHLIVRSDGSGFWSNEGSADDLKRQERRERTMAGLTDAQADVLAVIEEAGTWLTGRQVVEGVLPAGEEYDNRGVLAASTRKVLKRLEAIGLVETERVGRDRMFRLAGIGGGSGEESHPSRDERKVGGSNCSNAAAQGISPARVVALTGSHWLSSPPEPPEPPSPPEPPEPMRATGEPAPEQPKTLAPQHESQESNPPRSQHRRAAITTRATRAEDRSAAALGRSMAPRPGVARTAQQQP